MNNAKRSETLLKVFECIYEQHPNMQSTIESILVNVYRECLSREGVFYFLLFIIIESRQ